MLAELEFQRYRPRKALVEAVSRCDVLQVVCGSPAWAYAVCGAGKPVSLQCATRALVERRRRDARPRAITGWWRKAMTGITDQVDDLALRAVDAIQVENAWMYRYVLDRCAGREVDVRYAPPGVDARSFIPTPVRNLAPDSYILCVGRFDDPRKNVGLLLEAYALIPAPMRSRLRLLLAGETVPPEAFFRRAEALGLRDRVEVSLRPSQDELIALYQEASVFALPSDEEGLGVVLLEAMACGVPVVSTRSGGPEGVITDGEDGYLVPLGDAAALADRIVGLSSDTDLNRAMGMRARATIQARFAEEVAAQPFLEVWERLLSRVGTA